MCDQLEYLRMLLAHAHDSPSSGRIRRIWNKLVERLATPDGKLILRRIRDAQNETMYPARSL